MVPVFMICNHDFTVHFDGWSFSLRYVFHRSVAYFMHYFMNF